MKTKGDYDYDPGKYIDNPGLQNLYLNFGIDPLALLNRDKSSGGGNDLLDNPIDWKLLIKS